MTAAELRIVVDAYTEAIAVIAAYVRDRGLAPYLAAGASEEQLGRWAADW